MSNIADRCCTNLKRLDVERYSVHRTDAASSSTYALALFVLAFMCSKITNHSRKLTMTIVIRIRIENIARSASSSSGSPTSSSSSTTSNFQLLTGMACVCVLFRLLVEDRKRCILVLVFNNYRAGTPPSKTRITDKGKTIVCVPLFFCHC
jgi:hypothetical protein